MVDPCEMRETCKSRFTNFLANNENLIKQDNVTEDVINEKRAELSEIEKEHPLKNVIFASLKSTPFLTNN